MSKLRVLVLGASGMLGSAMMRVLSEDSRLSIFGTERASSACRFFSPEIAEHIFSGSDVGQHDSLVKLFTGVRPDVVINCIGLVKQLADADDPLVALPLNAMLPHRLSRLCELIDARLVHISTDCVFSGVKGNYRESDSPDAKDLYGRSKLLGEVSDPHAITLRTSIIGHELQSKHGLIDWFLSQGKRCKGYTQAMFSGFPTVVLAQIIRDVVIPKPEISGVYHVAAQPISKYALLKLVADVYGKDIQIIPDDQLVIDRSLNANRFQEATGYVPHQWPDLIKAMHAYHLQHQ